MRPSRRAVRRLVAAAAALCGLIPAAAASHAASGGTAGLFSQFFLPQGAQVSGVSGLIFTVIAPFAIVAIILYMVMRTVLDDTREVKVLSLLMALFVIPSGGYKVISAMLLSVFGFGTGAAIGGPGGQLVLPWVGHVPAPDVPMAAGVVAFLLSAWVINNWVTESDKDLEWTEYLGASGVGFVVWLALGGGVSILHFAGYVVFLWIAYEIFESGMEARRKEGFVVGLLGLTIFFLALSQFGLLPEQLQEIASIASTIAFLLIIAAVGLVGVIAYVFLKRAQESGLLAGTS